MMTKVKAILEKAPVDMEDVLQMEHVAKSNAGALLVAGSANAHVLALLECVGLGDKLASIEQPCTLICVKGEQLTIQLTTAAQSIACTSVEDLSQRLRGEESRGARVEIACPFDFPGRGKLVFAILDKQDYRRQLNDHALGASGAVIVMDGVIAPSNEAYQFAEWLATACKLRDAAAVLVYGGTDMLNCMPAMVMARKMGLEKLPVVTCNTARESLTEAVRKASAMLSGGADATDAQAREMAQRALEKLADAYQASESQAVLPKPPFSLAERFEANVSGVRVKVSGLMTAEMGNRLSDDLRDFSIFLQNEMEGIFLDAVARLDNPKEAMRAFGQGYLSDVMSAYSNALVRDLVECDIKPEMEKLFQELFKAAWINAGGSVDMAGNVDKAASNAAGSYQVVLDEMKLKGQGLVDAAFRAAMRFLLNRVMSGLGYIANAVSYPFLLAIHDIQFKLIKPESYAKQMAGQLKNALSQSAAQYQQMIQDSLLPQMNDGLSACFDECVAQLTASFREEDERQMQAYEQAKKAAEACGQTREQIKETMQELKELLKANQPR